MTAEPIITSERIDDFPPRLAVMLQRGLPDIFDHPIKRPWARQREPSHVPPASLSLCATKSLAVHQKTPGWRVYVSDAPAIQLNLKQAVLTYRDEWIIAHGYHRRKGTPLTTLQTRILELLGLCVAVYTRLAED